MICPVCGKDTLVVEFNNIALDYCQECGGVWFDAGELDLLLESAGFGGNEHYLENIKNSAEGITPEKKRRCPVCLRKMSKAYIDRESKIITDICRDGHGIWFDGGEVDGLIKSLSQKAPENKESQKVLGFIGELFKYRADTTSNKS